MDAEFICLSSINILHKDRSDKKICDIKKINNNKLINDEKINKKYL